MNKVLAATLVTAAALSFGATGASAKGCIKGAIVGGVAGHMAHHHGMMGAAAGCAVGHHMANKKAKDAQATDATAK